jgi:hypothetical protein
MRKVIYLIEYLGEFEFIFETILDYESGDQLGSFDVIKTSKISSLGTFKQWYRYFWLSLKRYCIKRPGSHGCVLICSFLLVAGSTLSLLTFSKFLSISFYCFLLSFYAM